MFSKVQPTADLIHNENWFRSPILSNRRMAFILVYYFVGHLFVFPLIWLVLLGFVYDLKTAQVYAQAVNDFFGLFVFLLLMYPLLEESFDVFRRNIRFTMVNSFMWYVPQILANAGLSLMIMLVTGLEQSANQNAVIDLYGQSFVALAIPSLLVAPMVEELVFRGIIFRYFRKHGFISAALISSVTFGLLHVLISLFTKNYADLIFILPYAIMAFFFCVAYEKTKNIYGPYVMHLLNNVIAMLAIGMTLMIL